MSIKSSFKRGILYTAISKYLGIAITLIISAVLSRILTPEDFGIVAIVTVFASALGAQLAGVLLAFPIAYVLISFSIHKGFGEIIVTRVIYSAILGTISLAVFCIVFALFLHKVPLIYGLCISLIGSVLITALLLVLQTKFQKYRLFLN